MNFPLFSQHTVCWDLSPDAASGEPASNSDFGHPHLSCCSCPKDAAACPILACWPHGGHLSRRELAALSLDVGRVYWAAHPAERGKKYLKYFLSLAFEKYSLFQCNSVPLVAYCTAQSSSPLWCFAHSIINFTKEKKNSSSLWEPRTNELEMWTELKLYHGFCSSRFFFIKWPKRIL